MVAFLSRHLKSDESLTDVNEFLAALGMPLYEYPAPNGYQELGFEWINTAQFYERTRLVDYLAFNESTVGRLEPMSTLRSRGLETGEGIAAYLLRFATGNRFQVSELQRAIDVLDSPSGEPFSWHSKRAEFAVRNLTRIVFGLPGANLQ